MTRLVLERDLRRQMGTAARQASSAYSIERTTHLMLEQYEHLIREAEPRHRGLRFQIRSLFEKYIR